MEAVQDLNIRETSPLAPPRQLRAEMPPDAIALDTVVEGRVEVERILSRRDDRMLAIVGPCCIHDPDAALENSTSCDASFEIGSVSSCAVISKNRAPLSVGRASCTTPTSMVPEISRRACD